MKFLTNWALSLFVSFGVLVNCAQAQPAVISSEFSRAELEQMLAPIALYPDTVLSHILIAATYPLEVVQADRWARSNSQLDASAAVNAVEHKKWDPSVKALVAFPQILERMSSDLEWTQSLGDAFLVGEPEVMEAIQDLRQRAYASGSLNDVKHVRVQREEKIIIIEPAVERVVYIPYYDTRTVYGSWRWVDYPPVYWHYPRDHLHVGGFYWGPRVHLSTSFFFSSVHWHNRRVVVIDYHRHNDLPRFYSGRRIARYDGARHWQHNPIHRRGVVYRNERLRDHYALQRPSLRRALERRDDDGRLDSHKFSSDRSSKILSSQRQSDSKKIHPRADARAEHKRDIQRQQPDRAETIKERIANGSPHKQWQSERKTSSSEILQQHGQQSQPSRRDELRASTGEPARSGFGLAKTDRAGYEQRRAQTEARRMSSVDTHRPQAEVKRSEVAGGKRFGGPVSESRAADLQRLRMERSQGQQMRREGGPRPEARDRSQRPSRMERP